MTPLVFAVAAALGNVAGALAVVRGERRSLRFIDACLAFGAGFMLAVATLGVLPVVLRDSPGVTLYVAASNLVPEFQAKRGGLTAAAFFGGALSFFVAERLLEAWIR